MPYRLGVDVGGTFTDLLLIDETAGRIEASRRGTRGPTVAPVCGANVRAPHDHPPEHLLPLARLSFGWRSLRGCSCANCAMA